MMVTLLRKPLGGNTISALPCGGMNIHAARVGDSGAITGGGQVGERKCPLIPGLRHLNEYVHQPYGRFPANLLFLPECGGTEHFKEVAL